MQGQQSLSGWEGGHNWLAKRDAGPDDTQLADHPVRKNGLVLGKHVVAQRRCCHKSDADFDLDSDHSEAPDYSEHVSRWWVLLNTVAMH